MLKIANVNPSPPEETTRKAITEFLSKFVQVEKLAPVIIKGEQDLPPEEQLCTRRWNALVTVQEGHKLVMVPHAQIHGVTIIITWKGSTCKVCQHCKTEGHWASQCNSALRTLALNKRLQKLPPTPLQIQEAQPTPIPPQETTQPTQTSPPAQTTPAESSTQNPTKTPSQKSTKQTSKQRDQAALDKSREVMIQMGVIEVTSEEDDGFKEVVYGKKKKNTGKGKATNRQTEVTNKRKAITSDEGSSRNYPANRQTRNLSVTDRSVRARSKGNMSQFVLHSLKNGSFNKEQAKDFLERVSPQDFIDITKPALSNNKYDNFAKFVARREKSGKTQDVEELEKYGVSVPDFLRPNNKSFVDTSVASEIKERKRRRRTESTPNTESSAEEGSSKPKKDETRIKVFYNDAEGKEQTFMTKFTINQMMGTLAKKIARILKRNQVVLHLKGSAQPINLEVTTTAAGLKNLTEIQVIEPVRTIEPGMVTIEVYNEKKDHTWTHSIKKEASVVSLYMEYARQMKLRDTDFIIKRSDDTYINRYTTIESLEMRTDEILFVEETKLTAAQIHWLDNNNTPQNKTAYVNTTKLLDDIVDNLKYELHLQFNFRIDDEQGPLSAWTDISDQIDSKQPDLYLVQDGQSKWNDTEFMATFPTATILTYVRQGSNHQTISTTVCEDQIILDVLNSVYSQFPALLGHKLVDLSQLPYDLHLPTKSLVLPGSLLETRLILSQKYTTEDLDSVIMELATQTQTEPMELLEKRFPACIAPPTQ